MFLQDGDAAFKPRGLCVGAGRARRSDNAGKTHLIQINQGQVKPTTSRNSITLCFVCRVLNPPEIYVGNRTVSVYILFSASDSSPESGSRNQIHLRLFTQLNSEMNDSFHLVIQ